LPGRITPGFTAGTCLCATEVDLLTGVVTATDMVLDPAENVLIATVTAHNCVTVSCDPDENPANELRIGGTLMNANTDPRLISGPITNRGFDIDRTLGNLVGVFGSAEGYFGIDDHLYFYVVELEGGALVNAGVTEVSLLRAQCRERDGEGAWNMIGATHNPATGTVRLRRGDTGAVLGTAQVLAEVDDPNFGAYFFRAFVPGTCPDVAIVDFGAASVTGDVDVRIELGPAVIQPLELQPRPDGNGIPVAVDDVITTTQTTPIPMATC